MTPLDGFRYYLTTYGVDTCRSVYIEKLDMDPGDFYQALDGQPKSMIELMKLNQLARPLFGLGVSQGRPTSALTTDEIIKLVKHLADNPARQFLVKHSITEQTLGKVLMGLPVALSSAKQIRQILGLVP